MGAVPAPVAVAFFNLHNGWSIILKRILLPACRIWTHFNDVNVKNDEGIKSTDPFTPDTVTLDPRLDWTVGRRGIPYLDWGPHPGEAWIRDQDFRRTLCPDKKCFLSIAGWSF